MSRAYRDEPDMGTLRAIIDCVGEMQQRPAAVRTPRQSVPAGMYVSPVPRAVSGQAPVVPRMAQRLRPQYTPDDRASRRNGTGEGEERRPQARGNNVGASLDSSMLVSRSTMTSLGEPHHRTPVNQQPQQPQRQRQAAGFAVSPTQNDWRDVRAGPTSSLSSSPMLRGGGVEALSITPRYGSEGDDDLSAGKRNAVPTASKEYNRPLHHQLNAKRQQVQQQQQEQESECGGEEVWDENSRLDDDGSMPRYSTPPPLPPAPLAYSHASSNVSKNGDSSPASSRGAGRERERRPAHQGFEEAPREERDRDRRAEPLRPIPANAPSDGRSHATSGSKKPAFTVTSTRGLSRVSVPAAAFGLHTKNGAGSQPASDHARSADRDATAQSRHKSSSGAPSSTASSLCSATTTTTTSANRSNTSGAREHHSKVGEASRPCHSDASVRDRAKEPSATSVERGRLSSPRTSPGRASEGSHARGTTASSASSYALDIGPRRSRLESEKGDRRGEGGQDRRDERSSRRTSPSPLPVVTTINDLSGGSEPFLTALAALQEAAAYGNPNTSPPASTSSGGGRGGGEGSSALGATTRTSTSRSLTTSGSRTPHTRDLPYPVKKETLLASAQLLSTAIVSLTAAAAASEEGRSARSLSSRLEAGGTDTQAGWACE